MTTVEAVAYRPVAAPRRDVWSPLARQEARRVLLHPILLVGVALSISVMAATFFHHASGRDALGAIDSAPTFFAGVLGLFAANLTATRDRRAGSREVLAPMPAREHERTRALCVASLAPALVALAAVLVAHFVFLSLGFYGTVPGAGLLLQASVTVLGGCLLGVMVGRWAPTRGAAVLTVAALIAFNVWTEGDVNARRPFGFMTSWEVWAAPGSAGYTKIIPGSPMWHVVYLLAFCGLAAVGAMLRTAPRRLPLLASGAGLVLVAIGAGIAQVG